MMKLFDGDSGSGSVVIPQEEYTIEHNATASALINFFGIVLIGTQSYDLLAIGIRDDYVPLSGNDIGEIALLNAFPFLNSTLTVTEENTLPGTAVQLYARVSYGANWVGSGVPYLTLYATTAGTFEDALGRVYQVLATTLPAANPEMFPLYANPAGSSSEKITCPNTGSSVVTSQLSGFFAPNGSANTLPLYYDPSGADPELRLLYDNGGTGVDFTFVSGTQSSGSGGSDLSKYIGVLTLYYDETQTDPTIT